MIVCGAGASPAAFAKSNLILAGPGFDFEGFKGFKVSRRFDDALKPVKPRNFETLQLETLHR
jgi:hypothetical protein